MKILIDVPCYNQIETIETIIQPVLAVDLDAEYEIIIVDDGSKDGIRD